MRPAKVLPAALLLLLAGCQAPVVQLPTEPSVSVIPTWSKPSLIQCKSCWEPTFAIAPNGTLVALADGHTVQVSTDAVNWTEQPSMPLPIGLPAGAANYTTGDDIIQFNAEGVLYYSALLFHPTSPRVPSTLGILVAWSTNLGQNWTVRSLAIPQADFSNQIADRQWLAFGQGGTMYLSYQQVPSGIWVARSDDGGVTWTPFSLAVSTAEKSTLGFHGQPAVAPDGTLAFPVGSYAKGPGDSSTGLPDPKFFGPQKLQMVVSRDKGATFQVLDIVTFNNGSVAPFPQMAIDDEGNYHVTWKNNKAGVWTASSVDGGRTWKPPLQWDTGLAFQGPWIETRGKQVQLFWFPREEGRCNAATANATVTSILAGISPPPPIEWTLDRSNARTDFVHAASSQAGFVFGWTLGVEKGIFVTRLLKDSLLSGSLDPE